MPALAGLCVCTEWMHVAAISEIMDGALVAFVRGRCVRTNNKVCVCTQPPKKEKDGTGRKIEEVKERERDRQREQAPQSRRPPELWPCAEKFYMGGQVRRISSGQLRQTVAH